MSNEQSAEQRNAGKGATGEPPVDEAADEAVADTGAHRADEGAAAATGEAGEESPEARIERLEQELESARAQAQDYWDRLVRSEAEKDNIRKRAQKDVDSARKQSLEKLAGELLAVRDSLELGVSAAYEDDADVARIREGTELTLKMLTQAMDKFSIEEINPEGEKFNPDLHQAMSMQEVEGQEPNTVISVMQKGYRLEDRLLRPALVMVAK
ncbi:MAG: nucleotide exchange factor GrpE [Halofilum sp. (in: g-proteobacteria)]|nr:nucleotide exchange factor GrpE [Halofilum sp. (in: g-proteobacteria)]